MQVLLADDDAATRDFVKHALEDEGHVVTIVQDGVEAVEKLDEKQSEFDILISDIAMPGLDGLAVAQKMLSKNPEMKMVLMSALDAELDRAKALNANNMKILSKPFSLDEIKSAVKELLAQ